MLLSKYDYISILVLSASEEGIYKPKIASRRTSNENHSTKTVIIKARNIN